MEFFITALVLGLGWFGVARFLKSQRNKTLIAATRAVERDLRKLSTSLPPIEEPNTMLADDEEFVLQLKGIEIVESLQAPRVSKRKTDAFTVALAKGLYYTAAAGTSVSTEPEDVLRVLDRGRAIFTTKRVLFIGKHRSREWEMKKIIGWEEEDGGAIYIATTNRKRISGLQPADPTKGLPPNLAFQIAGIAADEGWEAARESCANAISGVVMQRNIVQENPWASNEELTRLVRKAEAARRKKFEG